MFHKYLNYHKKAQEYFQRHAAPSTVKTGNYNAQNNVLQFDDFLKIESDTIANILLKGPYENLYYSG